LKKGHESFSSSKRHVTKEDNSDFVPSLKAMKNAKKFTNILDRRTFTKNIDENFLKIDIKFDNLYDIDHHSSREVDTSDYDKISKIFSECLEF